MFTFLARLILILTSFKAYGLEEVYLSKTWLRLLSYESNQTGYYSNAVHDYFFVSKEGRANPRAEWQAGVDAIKDNKKVGRLKTHYACSFPARYEVITNSLPRLKKKVSCPDFKKWSEEIDAKEIYLVYASSYISNPASMFGHSFIRLSRGGKTRSDALLDYSVGFMALTDTKDNSLVYSVKGITGKYNGHFEIKPFYMNVGLYSNAEDRDLWQYKLDFSEKETQFIVKALWEISTNTGFRYFFFDENCSYYMLKLLEIIRPSWNLLDRSFLFAHPVETLKWLDEVSDFEDPIYIESINKELRRKLEEMTTSQRRSFSLALKSEEYITEIKSQRVLDALIDYWKFYNYSQNTKISIKSKRLMNASLLQRSTLGKANYKLSKPVYMASNPVKFHDPNKIELRMGHQGEDEFVALKFNLGYQGLSDPRVGHDGYSFIDYLGFEANYKKSQLSFSKFNIVNIYSLTPYVSQIPKFSWALNIDYDKKDIYFSRDNLSTGGGFGATLSKRDKVFSSFFGMDIRSWKSDESIGATIQPYLEALALLHFNDLSLKLSAKSLLLKEKIKISTLNTLSYYVSEQLGLKFSVNNFVGERSLLESSLGLRYFW